MSLKAGVAMEILKVERRGGYRLLLRFSDGHVAAVDFGPFLREAQNPATRRYLNAKRFREFTLLHGNLVWGDYEMCFPIEDLYEGSIGTAQPVSEVLAVAESRAQYGRMDEATTPRAKKR
jgi:hypothetical protein